MQFEYMLATVLADKEERRVKAETVEEKLCKYGKEGFRLVSTEPIKSGDQLLGLTFIMEREIYDP